VEHRLRTLAAIEMKISLAAGVLCIWEASILTHARISTQQGALVRVRWSLRA